MESLGLEVMKQRLTKRYWQLVQCPPVEHVGQLRCIKVSRPEIENEPGRNIKQVRNEEPIGCTVSPPTRVKMSQEEGDQEVISEMLKRQVEKGTSGEKEEN